MEKQGVKETKEAILALVLLGKFVADRLHDGLQLDDALALAKVITEESDFKTKVLAGIEGLDKVPEELQDFTFAEILEIATIVPEILAVFQKPVAA
jgi:hypothetical protein